MAAVTKTGMRCEKTEQNPKGWKEISPKDISLNKPTVICFPGDGTTNPQGANSIAKNVEEMLGMVGLKDNEKEVQIIAIYYDNPDNQELHDGRQHFLEENKMKRKSTKEFSEDLINPPYIKQFYQEYIKPIIANENGEALDVNIAKKNMRNINIFAHCHGSYVASKLEEIMHKDMKHTGYSSDECKNILEQMAIVSIAPRTNFDKNNTTQIAFTNFDDWHFYDNNVATIKDVCNLGAENVLESTVGTFAMPGPFSSTKSRTSQLYAIDRMLNFNSEDDVFVAQLGNGTEELHSVKSYVSPTFSCKLGKKKEKGEAFTNLIIKSLQNAVSNSCENYKNDEFIGISKEVMLSDNDVSYKQGDIEKNKDYLGAKIGDVVKNANKVGKIMERKVLLNVIRKVVKAKGAVELEDPNLTAMIILDAKMHNIECNLKISDNKREQVDTEVLKCIDKLQSAKAPLTENVMKKVVAKQYMEMSGIEVNTSVWNNKTNEDMLAAPLKPQKLSLLNLDPSTLRYIKGKNQNE